MWVVFESHCVAYWISSDIQQAHRVCVEDYLEIVKDWVKTRSDLNETRRVCSQRYDFFAANAQLISAGTISAVSECRHSECSHGYPAILKELDREDNFLRVDSCTSTCIGQLESELAKQNYIVGFVFFENHSVIDRVVSSICKRDGGVVEDDCKVVETISAWRQAQETWSIAVQGNGFFTTDACSIGAGTVDGVSEGWNYD